MKIKERRGFVNHLKIKQEAQVVLRTTRSVNMENILNALVEKVIVDKA